MPGPRPKYAITLTPEQEARLHQLSTCYMAPFATVQRAQIVLLAPSPPGVAECRDCPASRVQCEHGQALATALANHGRGCAMRPGRELGATFTPLQRAQVVALACSSPRQYGKRGSAGRGRSWRRWRWPRAWSGPSRRGRSAAGCAPTRLSPGAIIRGSTRPIRSLSRKPYRCWTFTPRPCPCRRKEKSPSVLTKKRRFKPANASPPRKPQRQGK